MLARCVAVGGGDAGRFLAAMLEGVEREIGFARGVRMAVDGDDAAFFVELVGCANEWTVDEWTEWISGLLSCGASETCGNVGDAVDALKQQPAHAGTSPWRLASRAEAQRVRSSASGAEMKESPSTEISRRLPPVVPMRAERKLCSAGELFDFGNDSGCGGDEDGGSGLGKEAEERVSEERGVLLDGGADAFGECGLREGDGDAAVGDVAGRMDELAPGELGAAVCAGRLRLRDRARAECPRGCRG